MIKFQHRNILLQYLSYERDRLLERVSFLCDGKIAKN